MPEDFHSWPAKKTFSKVQRNRWSAGLFVMFLFLLSQWWYQIGRQPVGCRLKTAYYIGSLEKPCRSSGTTSLFLPGQFPRLSGWCSRWAPRLVQPVGYQLAGAASQRSNSMVSHTKYFKRAKHWIVSLYGPFFELAHICAIFPM